MTFSRAISTVYLHYTKASLNILLAPVRPLYCMHAQVAIHVVKNIKLNCSIGAREMSCIIVSGNKALLVHEYAYVLGQLFCTVLLCFFYISYILINHLLKK